MWTNSGQGLAGAEAGAHHGLENLHLIAFRGPGPTLWQGLGLWSLADGTAQSLSGPRHCFPGCTGPRLLTQGWLSAFGRRESDSPAAGFQS